VLAAQVRQVFLAGSNDFGQTLKYVYATDGVHEQLMKLDVKALKLVKRISLTQYHCVPLSAVFIHIGAAIITHAVSLSTAY